MVGKTWGRDAFGVFKIQHFLSPSEGKECNNCHQSVTTLIEYGDPVFPSGILVGDTILSKGSLGLDCGCYAKLHRQVAHIVDRMSARTGR